MIQEIRQNLFRIEVPLPGSPLKALNSYVVRAQERSLIIDTGFNREECFRAMIEGIAQVGLDLQRTDLFVTHLHVDHLGLVARLATDSSKTYFSKTENEIVKAWTGWEPMVVHAIQNGFPENEARTSLSRHPAFHYGPQGVPPLTLVRDGDTIAVGDYHFLCVETPGHTPGHTCLYDPNLKILISGDHLLADITPNIQCWSDLENPLESYLASLDKVGTLEVDLTLPGHRGLIRDHRQRIRELKQHHRQRAQEVLAILEKGPATAFAVAGQMTWDIACASWDEFPVAQKWFALGEAIAHLRYLEGKGEIQRDPQGSVRLFSRTQKTPGAPHPY